MNRGWIVKYGNSGGPVLVLEYVAWESPDGKIVHGEEPKNIAIRNKHYVLDLSGYYDDTKVEFEITRKSFCRDVQLIFTIKLLHLTDALIIVNGIHWSTFHAGPGARGFQIGFSEQIRVDAEGIVKADRTGSFWWGF